MDKERLYAVDDGSILGAFDLSTGKELWTKTLGTIQKSSPVLADGKLYIGTENGKFYILRPSATGAEVLDEDLLGEPANPEPILASPAISEGRIYVVTYPPISDIKGSAGHLYAIGGKRRPAAAGAVNGVLRSTNPVAQVQVFPHEAILDPNGKQAYTLKLYDAQGSFIRAEPAANAKWEVEGVQGTVAADGTLTVTAASAGFVKATVGDVSGQARVRVVPPLPWTYDFESAKTPMPWWTANAKTTIGTGENAGVLVRPRDDTVGRRAKLFMGRPEWSGYTVEVDVKGVEARRQRGDVGLINQRYGLVLFGNAQKLELHPWQAADEMTVQVPFTWDVNTWYRMKLRVDNQKDGTALVRGKVWKVGSAEPAAWTIQKIDRIPHLKGAPGIYGDGISDVFFDNLRVYRNQ
jgi:hypothetical protein